jgi:hypothetical protein
MDPSDLADACQALAENLDDEQRALNFEGQQAITLGKLSANLSAQASTLRTLVVADAIANSASAVAALKDATTAAKQAAGSLQVAATAIQIAGLVLSVGAAVISENPGAIVSAGTNLVNAVRNLGKQAPAAPV